jgi:hypothetical protein
MPEQYDDVIFGAFGDFTEDAESTITAAGTGDVRKKVRRRRIRAMVAIALVVMLVVVVGVVLIGG